MTNLIQSANSPSALAEQTSTITNVTGDGTVYQAVFNNLASGGNFNTVTGVFTATLSGMYLFTIGSYFTSLSAAATSAVCTLVTTNATYTFSKYNPGAWRDSSNRSLLLGQVVANMIANDTSHVNVQVSNTTKTIGFGSGLSYISIWRLF